MNENEKENYDTNTKLLVRIVKMSFEPEAIDTFESNFEHHKDQIRAFEGCSFLELLQDMNQKNVFFTYSYWQSAHHLEQYRNSALFKSVWAKTKVLFNAKPEAWSVEKSVTLN